MSKAERHIKKLVKQLSDTISLMKAFVQSTDKQTEDVQDMRKPCDWGLESLPNQSLIWILPLSPQSVFQELAASQ